MKYTNELVTIDTAEKAYFIGLMIADGTVAFNKKSGAYATTLKLKESDKHLLDEIIQLYPFFRMGKIEIHKDGFKSYYIRHYNKQLTLDLISHSVLPRKSYENAPKVELIDLSDSLFFAYLHGLFDGDGTIHQSKKGHIRMEVIGKTGNLLKQISEKLLSLGIKNQFYYRKSRDYWMVRLSDKENVKLLIEEFSKTPICLHRKFKPFFCADWARVPGHDNKTKKYPIWFATTSKSKQVHHS